MLNIGSGSGLIALMLAQRGGDGTIDAVELDEAAAGQARENAAASPWPQRIRVHAQDIHYYAQRHAAEYDLIVSNPPYFEPAVACRDQARHNARYTENPDARGAVGLRAQLLAEQGTFCGAAARYRHRIRTPGAAKRLAHGGENERQRSGRYAAAPGAAGADAAGNAAAGAGAGDQAADGSYTDDFRHLIADFYLFY
ncbi:methyltransferase [Serratia ureilytica]